MDTCLAWVLGHNPLPALYSTQSNGECWPLVQALLLLGQRAQPSTWGQFSLEPGLPLKYIIRQGRDSVYHHHSPKLLKGLPHDKCSVTERLKVFSLSLQYFEYFMPCRSSRFKEDHLFPWPIEKRKHNCTYFRKLNFQPWVQVILKFSNQQQ